MNKCVVTGGVYAGKTTLVRELSAGGFAKVPEAEMQVVAELKKKTGLDGVDWAHWLIEHYSEFITSVAEKKIKIETEAEKKYKGTVLYDRAFLDLVAWCRLRDIEVPSIVRERAQDFNYNLVFNCKTFEDFDPRPETGRIITKDEAMRLGDITRQVYEEYGHRVLDVPYGDRHEAENFVIWKIIKN